MHKKPKILVVGSLVMDLVVCTEKFPSSGETVLGKDFRTAPGGKGANQAVQAARLGAEVTMVGKVGNDDFGRRLLASCREAQIHTECISVDPEKPTAVGNILLEVGHHQESKNRIIVVPGANMAILPEDVAFLKDEIRQYDMVVLQQEIPSEINDLVAGYAAAKGVPVMLNPAPSAPIPDRMLSCLTYISPNEHETADLTGVRIRKEGKTVNQDDLKAAVDVLLGKGISNVVITLGNSGVVLANKYEWIYQPCIDVVEVQDPTAAGDSFVGAFAVGVCSGLSRSQALIFANYTATLTVSRMGAQPSLPGIEEVIGLMSNQNESRVDISLLQA